MRKLIYKIFFRKYSGEYRIFHFTGFNKINEHKNSSESIQNASELPGCTNQTPKPLQKVIQTAQGICASTKALAPDLTLISKKECNKSSIKKKISKGKCLRPVPRLRPVNELPAPCNVKKTDMPTLKLNNGCEMPMIGLGTWGSEQKKVKKAVLKAIQVGYRMIDCAHVYGNEEAVGKAINKAFKKCIVTRDELFVTSKLWNTHHRPDLVKEGCRRTLSDLKLFYLNLYLIHWPFGYKEGCDLIPYDACGRILTSRVDYVETWKAMEELVNDGYTKSIGVANFNKAQIERILKVATIKPVVNQVECHPYLNQKRLMKYLKNKNIALTAYSPLGSPARPWAKPDEPNILEDKVINNIASEYNRTVAQICIRYQIQRGNIVIPKSVTPSRIESNFKVMDFELSSQDMKTIDELDCKLRFVPLSKLSNHPYYPFHDAY